MDETPSERKQFMDTEELYYEELSEKVTRDKNTTPRGIPKIQVPHRSNIFKVATSEIKIKRPCKEDRIDEVRVRKSDMKKKKFKDKVQLKEMVRVRTVKRFFQ